MSFAEQLVQLLESVGTGGDLSFIAAFVLNRIDPLYRGEVDWQSFFKELNPAHIKSLNKWLLQNQLEDRY